MAVSFIFDMDGTLFQTNKILELALDDTFQYLREAGLWEKETPIKKYQQIMGVPLPVVWETLLPIHTEEVRKRANELFHERLIANINEGNGALYPNVEKVFSYIKKHHGGIYIASNGQKAYLEAIVQHYKLNRWITETFSIEQIHTLDKSDLVGRIVEKYNIQRGAVIGDRISDIRAAKRNGLMAIGCRFDFAQEEELAEADCCVDNLAELPSIFLEMCGESLAK